MAWLGHGVVQHSCTVLCDGPIFLCVDDQYSYLRIGGRDFLIPVCVRILF